MRQCQSCYHDPQTEVCGSWDHALLEMWICGRKFCCCRAALLFNCTQFQCLLWSDHTAVVLPLPLSRLLALHWSSTCTLLYASHVSICYFWCLTSYLFCCRQFQLTYILIWIWNTNVKRICHNRKVMNNSGIMSLRMSILLHGCFTFKLDSVCSCACIYLVYYKNYLLGVFLEKTA